MNRPDTGFWLGVGLALIVTLLLVALALGIILELEGKLI